MYKMATDTKEPTLEEITHMIQEAAEISKFPATRPLYEYFKSLEVPEVIPINKSEDYHGINPGLRKITEADPNEWGGGAFRERVTNIVYTFGFLGFYEGIDLSSAHMILFISLEGEVDPFPENKGNTIHVYDGGTPSEFLQYTKLYNYERVDFGGWCRYSMDGTTISQQLRGSTMSHARNTLKFNEMIVDLCEEVYPKES